MVGITKAEQKAATAQFVRERLAAIKKSLTKTYTITTIQLRPDTDSGELE